MAIQSIRSLPEQVRAIIQQAIQEHIFPGAVVGIHKDNRILAFQAFGTMTYETAVAQPVLTDTIYDIASLTKIITATAALRLMEQGQLDIYAPVQAYLPELALQSVTIWHLLTHSSGIDLKLSTLANIGAATLRRSIAQVQPSYIPGTVAAYTNINSLLLGQVVAKVYGASLDQALHELVAQPLGMHETQFCPPESLHKRIAPTEIDDVLRGGVVHCVVHDESAYVLGGIAGHAGLFSTCADLLHFAQAWLGQEPYQDFLKTETRLLAFQNHCSGLELSCGLGWMLNRPAFMGAAAKQAVGHTGFTGPVLMLVPDLVLALVVLSNRTYPKRRAPAHHAVTAQLLETVLSLQTDNQNML